MSINCSLNYEVHSQQDKSVDKESQMILVGFHMEVLSVLKQKLFCNDQKYIRDTDTVAQFFPA